MIPQLLLIAVLIDAENSSPRLIKHIITLLEKSGRTILLFKAYADWTSPFVKSWKYEMKDMPVETVQRFAYGKNSTDITISVDAIEIVHTRPQIQGICFVSSDGDFEIPARKIKDKGLYVMGVGEMKTRKNFVKLCDEFIYTDDPAHPLNPLEVTQTITSEIIDQAYEKSMDATGLVKLSTMGHHLKQLIPGFSITKTGYASLSGLIKSFAPKYELLPDTKGGLLVKRNA